MHLVSALWGGRRAAALDRGNCFCFKRFSLLILTDIIPLKSAPDSLGEASNFTGWSILRSRIAESRGSRRILKANFEINGNGGSH